VSLRSGPVIDTKQHAELTLTLRDFVDVWYRRHPAQPVFTSIQFILPRSSQFALAPLSQPPVFHLDIRLGVCLGISIRVRSKTELVERVPTPRLNLPGYLCG
jgi:hypothetical protein